MVFGGYRGEDDDMNRNLVYSTKRSDLKNSRLQTDDVKLVNGDFFEHNRTFPLSSELISQHFVEFRVKSLYMKRDLRDLTYPQSRLFAIAGYRGLHIFD